MMHELLAIWEPVRHVIAGVMLLSGVGFMLTGAFGVLRLPDFYTRIHAAGITDTLASTLLLGGLIVESGWTQMSLKLALVGVLLFLTSPTSTHAMINAAHKAGLKPRLGTVKSKDPREQRVEDET